MALYTHQEISALLKSLHHSKDDDSWLTSLEGIELKKRWSDVDCLTALKSMILYTTTCQALKNLAQVFVQKVSIMIQEKQLLKREETCVQVLALVKDFWSLCANQHNAISQEIFGQYIPEFSMVLPSLASVYVDLFITVNRSKDKKEVLSKKLYSWLMFEMNERCIKTALLEVTSCSKTGSKFMLPVLRKLLNDPPMKSSHLDYLLHVILLKRWLPVCKGIADISRKTLNVKAPTGFVKWLSSLWAETATYFPTDKSLKGRRVTEVLMELDAGAIEELIDVFSQCLWSERGDVETTANTSEEITTQQEDIQLFTIDVKGDRQEQEKKKSSDDEEMEMEDEEFEERTHSRHDSLDSDIFLPPGLDIEDCTFTMDKHGKKKKGSSSKNKKADKESNADEELSNEGSVEEEEEDGRWNSSEEEIASDDHDEVAALTADTKGTAKKQSLKKGINIPGKEKADENVQATPFKSKPSQIENSKERKDVSLKNSDEKSLDRQSHFQTPVSLHSLTGGSDPVLSYFVPKSDQPRHNSILKALENKDQPCDDVQIIDGTEVHIINADEVHDPRSNEDESHGKQKRKRKRSSSVGDNNSLLLDTFNTPVSSKKRTEIPKSSEIHISSDSDKESNPRKKRTKLSLTPKGKEGDSSSVTIDGGFISDSDGSNDAQRIRDNKSSSSKKNSGTDGIHPSQRTPESVDVQEDKGISRKRKSLGKSNASETLDVNESYSNNSNDVPVMNLRNRTVSESSNSLTNSPSKRKIRSNSINLSPKMPESKDAIVNSQAKKSDENQSAFKSINVDGSDSNDFDDGQVMKLRRRTVSDSSSSTKSPSKKKARMDVINLSPRTLESKDATADLQRKKSVKNQSAFTSINVDDSDSNDSNDVQIMNLQNRTGSDRNSSLITSPSKKKSRSESFSSSNTPQSEDTTVTVQIDKIISEIRRSVDNPGACENIDDDGSSPSLNRNESSSEMSSGLKGKTPGTPRQKTTELKDGRKEKNNQSHPLSDWLLKSPSKSALNVKSCSNNSDDKSNVQLVPEDEDSDVEIVTKPQTRQGVKESPSSSKNARVSLTGDRNKAGTSTTQKLDKDSSHSGSVASEITPPSPSDSESLLTPSGKRSYNLRASHSTTSQHSPRQKNTSKVMNSGDAEVVTPRSSPRKSVRNSRIGAIATSSPSSSSQTDSPSSTKRSLRSTSSRR